MEKVLKIIRAEVKDINTENHTLVATISTKKVDRDGDVILPEAFSKRIKNYKEHPVFLSSHNYNRLTNQIGKAVNISIGDDEVTAKFEYFVGQGNEEADWAWVLAQKNVAAFSIGFMGHEFEWLKEKDADGNERITGRKFTDIELLEVSQVLVPSNRGALQNGRALAQEELELCDLAIKSFKDDDFKIPPRKKLEDRIWFCEKCGNGFTFLEGSLEFICSCGNKCVEKKIVETKKNDHYSDVLLGKEEQRSTSEPKGEEIDIGAMTGMARMAISDLTVKEPNE
jgi:HK97 family phage prohead protease